MRRTPLGWLLSLLLVTLVANQAVHAENWPRFRGPNGTGVSEQKGIPVRWDKKDYAWDIELPGVGHGEPIIWDDTLFVTSAVEEGAVRYFFCIDANSGQTRWVRSIGMNRSHKHAKNSWASTTPTTDGELVYVSFADEERYVVTAYDYSGEVVWRRILGSFESQHGLGVSPILFEDLLIVPNDQKGPSSIVALDKRTGRTVWSTLRAIRRTSYATPCVVQLPGQPPQIICVSGATGVTSLDPSTGMLNWAAGEFPLRTVASPVFGGGLVIASCGQGGRYGVLQIAVDPSLDSRRTGSSRIRWSRSKYIPYVPTPIVYNGRLFNWNDQGIIACVDVQTGKDIWVKRVGGNYSGSPVCIDGKLYCISENGDVTVVRAADTFELLGQTPLGDPSHSTPAVANGRLYLRSYHRLACLPARPVE